MSILSVAFNDVKAGVPLDQVWAKAKAAVSTYIQQRKAADPVLAAAIDTTEADLKQGISDAISMADSALGAHIAPAVSAIENALDAAFLSATRGAGVLAVPLVNAGIENMANVFHTAVDAWALKTKASLASPPK